MRRIVVQICAVQWMISLAQHTAAGFRPCTRPHLGALLDIAPCRAHRARSKITRYPVVVDGGPLWGETANGEAPLPCECTQRVPGASRGYMTATTGALGPVKSQVGGENTQRVRYFCINLAYVETCWTGGGENANHITIRCNGCTTLGF